jgi:hypothetical protein
LRGPDDALDVVAVALSHPPSLETVCLLLDHAHRGDVIVSIAGAGEADHMAGIGALLSDLAMRDPQLGAVVLATARPRGGAVPTHDDELSFLGLRGELEGAGVDLLDWFLVADGMAASLAELTDARSLWHIGGEQPGE